MSEFTKYFDNCKAVFQGGGCKAIAYIGAYEYAYSRGVFFTELAGTSAGAIIAAFIAAGATPDQLIDLVKKTNFTDFVTKSIAPSLIEKIILNKLGVKSKGLSLHRNVTNNLGLYSLDVLENFIEEQLQCFTKKQHEIRFIDLIPNLHVVSVDLYTHTIKVWSKDKTPMERVAKAVCASCALPLFFIPIDGRYIDGGVLCNLPNFIFADNAHYNKMLSFRFTPNQNNIPQSKLKEYIGHLIDTIVQGAAEMHKLLTPNQETYDIQINVTDVNTTDFAKINVENINKLIEEGRLATKKFFDNERFFSYSKPNRVTKKLRTLEEVHSLVAYLGNDAHNEVIVSYRNTKWTWMLFPTLLKWCTNKAKITIYYQNEGLDNWGQARKRMLEAMNIKIVEQEHLPCEGFFFFGYNTWKGIIITSANNQFYAKYFNDTADNEAIKLVVNNFYERSEHKSNKPIFKPIPTSELFDAMKIENIYKNAEFELREVDIDTLNFMNPFIRALKYKQIDVMYRLYKDAHLPFFSPATIEFKHDILEKCKCSIIGLPVVEEHGGDLYVIEGNTRLTYAFKHGIKSMYVVIVKNVQTPLPCGPISRFYKVDEILLSDRKIEGIDRFGKDWDYSTFRHIESALRPANSYLNFETSKASK